jgi:hypothetical protein
MIVFDTVHNEEKKMDIREYLDIVSSIIRYRYKIVSHSTIYKVSKVERRSNRTLPVSGTYFEYEEFRRMDTDLANQKQYMYVPREFDLKIYLKEHYGGWEKFYKNPAQIPSEVKVIEPPPEIEEKTKEPDIQTEDLEKYFSNLPLDLKPSMKTRIVYILKAPMNTIKYWFGVKSSNTVAGNIFENTISAFLYTFIIWLLFRIFGVKLII